MMPYSVTGSLSTYKPIMKLPISVVVVDVDDVVSLSLKLKNILFLPHVNFCDTKSNDVQFCSK